MISDAEFRSSNDVSKAQWKHLHARWGSRGRHPAPGVDDEEDQSLFLTSPRILEPFEAHVPCMRWAVRPRVSKQPPGYHRCSRVFVRPSVSRIQQNFLAGSGFEPGRAEEWNRIVYKLLQNPLEF